jgi:hypothetical protein
MTVNPLPPSQLATSLVYNGTLSVQYYATASLSATLKDANNKFLNGKSILFTIGSLSVSATTNTKGVASASLFITLVPGNYQIVATFAGDAAYLSSIDNTHTLTVTKKPVTASLVGTVTKVYDGNTIAYMSPANYSLSGPVPGDVVGLNNPPTGTYNNNKIGTNKKVTVTGLALTGTNAGNYSLTNTTASANIGIITAVKSAEIVSDVTTDVQTVETPTLKVYPNPFTEKLNIEFSSLTDTHAKLEIFNIDGAELEVLFNGDITANDLNSIEYIPRLIGSQIVIYRLTMNGKISQGKLIYQEKK